MMRRAAATPDLVSELNPEQLAAVTHGEGPQLVIAGAGSGKTRVITYRIAWLIGEQEVDPARIVAVTFTNKAASEMRERVEMLVQRSPLRSFVGTFHRFALRLLRRYGERVGLRRDFAIADSSDQLKLVKKALEMEELSERSFPPRAVLSAISSAKNRLLDPQAFEARAEGFFQRKIVPVYRRYQHLLRQGSTVDFDDMILLAVRLLEDEGKLGERLRSQVDYLLVDEFQDTNHAQLRLVKALAGKNGNLTAVGDEDQGIYRWRGADLDNILGFEQEFPGATVRKLERNYRSTQTILDASGALVAHNRSRRGKQLWTEDGAGEDIQLYRAADEGDEARWLVTNFRRLQDDYPLAGMAILVRTNAQTRALEDELLRRGMPYELVGGTRFYDRAEIKDLVAYLRAIRNPQDELSLGRILNQPPRGIGKGTRDLLESRAQELRQPLWDVLQLQEFGNFPSRSARALSSFRDLMITLQKLAQQLPLPALLDQLLEATSYTDLYNSNDSDGQARLENIREFLSAAQDFTESYAYRGEDDDVLTAFLDRVALVSDTDSWKGREGVTLMTLHSAKGLEFPVVAVAGLEEGLLPHYNANKTAEDLEEERRLLYVGMTRARERLLLTTCRRRRIAGRYQDQQPSPFLAEIPEEHLDVTDSPSLFDRGVQRAQGVYDFFGRPTPRTSSDPSVEPVADDSGGSGLQRGSRVRHPTLGSGVVLEIDGEGDQMKISVFFQSSGKRKLIARYANLELL
ncbi:MAG: UvrD-helicase domain-containing protein [Acidobacteriota bacterium]|nr:UvrD-helicase domain-containing protein [Acidobacteriota bacterium]